MPKPKKGDIVILKRWGSIVGKVISYKERHLKLGWPLALLGDGCIHATQEYSSVEPEDIVILSAQETWKCLTMVFAAYKKRMNIDRSEPVLWIVTGDPDKIIEKAFNKAKERENKTKKAQ